MSHPQAPAPLLEIDAAEAVEIRKANPFASWGRRDAANRVEPITTPDFAVPFQLVKGESIFTIGSCFARNVELKLMEKGFDIPIRNLFKKPEFASLNPGIVNNFGTPSIFNEFSWALDPDNPFDFDNNISEVMNGKYSDLHIISSERPLPFDEAKRRRQAIIDATREVKNCRVVIMTLGLIELWFDKQQGLYLNSAPMPSLIKSQPERFSIRVLDFNSAKFYLDKALDVLKAHCRPDQQVIITVSPVPLMATHRPMDVIVANAYSKSLLRAVAEHCLIERDNVHYYPSYESVVHSNRQEAWKDDFTHVTDKIVAINIGRMVSAYAPGATDSVEETFADLEAGGISVILARSAEFINETADKGLPFLDRFSAFFEQSEELAYAAASAYFRWGDLDAALEALHKTPKDWDPVRRNLLEARLYAKKGDFKRVLSILEPWLADKPRIDGAWELLVQARAVEDTFERAQEALMDWTKLSPKRSVLGLMTLARTLTPLNPQKAVETFEKLVKLEPLTPPDCLTYAEAMVRAGNGDGARDYLNSFKFDVFGYESRRTKMLETL